MMIVDATICLQEMTVKSMIEVCDVTDKTQDMTNCNMATQMGLFNDISTLHNRYPSIHLYTKMGVINPFSVHIRFYIPLEKIT
jgi:hypothetical protein